jgi:hemerythrin-like domain-containing protein
MVVQLGAKRQADDVIGKLVDCHGRIRTFVDVVVRMGAAETLTGEDVKSAARDVRRYFSEALPRHVEDEEESLLPRLSGRDPALDTALQRMHAEHLDHEPLVAALLSECEALALEKAARQQLIDLGVELGRAFSAHLVEEETIIFPAIARWITKSEQEAILTEMRGRRSGR